MKWLNEYRMRLVLVGFVAVIVLCGGSVNADIIMSEPANLGPMINDAYNVQECDFSHDGLQLYFAVWGRPDGFGSGDIYMTERETLNSPWQEPVNLGPNVNSSGREIEPSISSDGLELYFGSWDDYKLSVCTRSSKDAPWGSPVKIGPPVGTDGSAMEIGSNDAWSPDISADGLSLYFTSTRVGGFGDGDICVAKRATKDDQWGEPVNLGSNVNTSSNDWSPSISTDGLTLVFSRGFKSMWTTTRKSIDDDWGPAVELSFTLPPGQWNQFFAPALSPDGSTLCFRASLDWGGFGKGDFWQVEFIPIVDFNCDETVDIADLVILIEHWGQEEPSFDIGPLPLGDGVVDEADLEVLMSHWGQEVQPLDLIAYWKLDETEGDIACDSARTNDAAVLGDPVWQPESGMVDGAIAFDGIDDYISTDFVLNPADGAFSVFAWIKGGAPGQVIISQADGTGETWLGIDPLEGALSTELEPPETRTAMQPLLSDMVISDDEWHHIGLVWYSTFRALYVDGVSVAEDAVALAPLKSADGGLYFGAGKTLDKGTFFSGLIDDIRIYNVALTAEQIEQLAQ